MRGIQREYSEDFLSEVPVYQAIYTRTASKLWEKISYTGETWENVHALRLSNVLKCNFLE
jgi:hypothetical protein